VGVDRVRCVQAESLAGLGRVQRSEYEVVGAPVERPVVGGQTLHHVQIAAQQEQQYGSGGEQPVPGGLQRAVEQGVLFGEPGQFVEYDDARRVG